MTRSAALLLSILAGALACTQTAPAPGAPSTQGPANAEPQARAGANSQLAIAQDPPPPSSPPEAVEPASEPEARGPFALPMIEAASPAAAPPADPKRYAKWKQRARIDVGKSHLDTAFLTHNGQFLVVRSDAEATVRVYDAQTRKLLANHQVGGFTPGKFQRGTVLAWPSSDGGESFLVLSERGLDRVSAKDGSLMTQFDTRGHWEGRWSEDGNYLFSVESAIATQSSIVRVYRRDDQNGLHPLAQINSVLRIDELAISRDNGRIAMVTYPAEELIVADLNSGDVLWRRKLPNYVSTVDFSPDGTLVAVGGEHILVFDVADPERSASYESLNNNAHRVRFSPSGDALAVSAYDGRVRILATKLDGPRLRLIKEFRHSGSANVYSLEWLPDGTGLWTSSGDRSVRLWAGRN